VGDFPEVAVGVGEVAAVAAPECWLARLFDPCAGPLGQGQDFNDIGMRADIVRERDASEL
jgi:hypothetical protein